MGGLIFHPVGPNTALNLIDRGAYKSVNSYSENVCADRTRYSRQVVAASVDVVVIPWESGR